jgi:hypothetical protein
MQRAGHTPAVITEVKRYEHSKGKELWAIFESNFCPEMINARRKFYCE